MLINHYIDANSLTCNYYTASQVAGMFKKSRVEIYNLLKKLRIKTYPRCVPVNSTFAHSPQSRFKKVFLVNGLSREQISQITDYLSNRQC